MIDAAALDDPELFVRSESLASEIGRELSEHPIAYELSNLSLPSMLHVAKKETIVTARLRCLGIVLEVERWRRKHGERLPREDELNLLFKDYPRDPLDGAPLQFHPDGHGAYRIIAVAATAAEKKGGVNANSPGIGFSIVGF
ncbi:MAG: hypothetical protein JWM99_1741 [Verrucomicrobiales bacterium]|nr:hypothetical protein [Verrucomicrobiales bacterium]